MQKRPPNLFHHGIWKQIECLFRQQDLGCMPRGSAVDGLDPLEIESTKHGIEIHGGIWFLPGGKGSPNPRYDLHLLLSRPRFSSFDSVTVEKLGNSTISESSLEDRLLRIVIS